MSPVEFNYGPCKQPNAATQPERFAPARLIPPAAPDLPHELPEFAHPPFLALPE
jgi:hypothetical protein